MCLHGEVSSDAPPPLGVRPFSSGYAQNRHEILRMPRNHHANPPTRIPVTARMCRSEPRPRRELWVCELSRDRRMGLIPKRTTVYVLVNRSARRSLGVDGLDFYLEGQMIWKPSMS